MRKLLLVAAASIVPQAAQAEERTPATAFAFIEDMVTDGSWTGKAGFCRQINNRSECGITNDNRIIRAESADSSYCKLTFTMAFPGTPPTVTRSVNFTRNFTFSYGTYPYVWFFGPVADSNGDTVPDWMMHGPSPQVADQVGKALQFIYESCRTESVWQTQE